MGQRIVHFRKRRDGERTVRRGLNDFRQGLDLYLEPALDGRQDLLVGLARDERDGESAGTEATGTANTVEVRVGVARLVVVNDNVDALNVDTAAEDVSRDEDALLERLELPVPLNTESRPMKVSKTRPFARTPSFSKDAPLVLREARVDAD
jgi:hypothetical protein